MNNEEMFLVALIVNQAIMAATAVYCTRMFSATVDNVTELFRKQSEAKAGRHKAEVARLEHPFYAGEMPVIKRESRQERKDRSQVEAEMRRLEAMGHGRQ